MIKIDVISGFLGAGKTTLIKRLFQTKFNNEKVVLIENEFGEIGIDGAFLKDSGVEIKEINSGCICCSLVGDFATSMKELIDKYSPDRIIVEPSGVGKLSDIINAIKKVEHPLTLNIVTTVVDGSKAKSYMKNFGEFFIDQVESANSIVISRADKVSADKIDEVIELLREKNKSANIVIMDNEEMDNQALLEVLEKQISLNEEILKQLEDEHQHCCCHEHEHEDGHGHDGGHCCCHEHEHGHEHDHHHEHEHEDGHCCCHEHEHDHHHEHEHEHGHSDGHCCCHEHEHVHGHDDGHGHDGGHCCCHEHEHEHGHDDGHGHDGGHCCCHEHEHEHEHHHHGHDADEVFTSIGFETSKAVSYSELESFLKSLNNEITMGLVLRAKGILPSKDSEDWYYFDFVSGEYEIRTGKADFIGRLCIIGSSLEEENIKKLFFNRG